MSTGMANVLDLLQPWCPILQFAGTKPLASLPVSPLSQSEDKTAIEKRAMARGKTFEALPGLSFQSLQRCGLEKRLARSWLDTMCKVVSSLILQARPHYRA